jgi:CheY-like chemotaxis protein
LAKNISLSREASHCSHKEGARKAAYTKMFHGMNDDENDAHSHVQPRWGSASDLEEEMGHHGGGFGNFGGGNNGNNLSKLFPSHHPHSRTQHCLWDSGERHVDIHESLDGGSACGDFVNSPVRGAGGWDRSGLRVLVAEDDELCKRFLTRQLEQLGVHQILAVDNGLEAMRAVRRENFTHVFLDLVLPCIDGEASADTKPPRPLWFSLSYS